MEVGGGKHPFFPGRIGGRRRTPGSRSEEDWFKRGGGDVFLGKEIEVEEEEEEKKMIV